MLHSSYQVTFNQFLPNLAFEPFLLLLFSYNSLEAEKCVSMQSYFHLNPKNSFLINQGLIQVSGKGCVKGCVTISLPKVPFPLLIFVIMSVNCFEIRTTFTSLKFNFFMVVSVPAKPFESF